MAGLVKGRMAAINGAFFSWLDLLLETELVQTLFSNIRVFLSSQKREVVRSTLVLVRVTIGILSPDTLAPHVEPLVRN